MKKVLIIEDNDTIRENTSEILKLANYKVFTAENGKKGVEAALRENPDLIICDIMMPVLDGYGVLHLLRKNLETRNTPFIFLTAKSERAEMRKGMELGADDYITKPFEETELLNAVESQLHKMDLLMQDISPGGQAHGGYGHVESEPEIKNEKDILRLLTENRNINKYKKGQAVYSEGNHPSCLYYVEKGKVKIYKTNDDGKELIVGLYKEGDFIGYVALLEGSVYKEMAEAMELTELAVIPKEDFDGLINRSREVARKFITMLAKNVTEKQEHLLGLAYNSLRKKVAEALLTLNKTYNTAINMSRENLANIAGTATESLIRTLVDFKNEKLIDITEGKIIILNEKKLASMIK